MPLVGLEPTRLSTSVPKTEASTYSATKALISKILKNLNYVNFNFMLKLKELLKKQILKKNINLLIFFILCSFLFGNIFGLNSKIFLMKSPESLFFICPFIVELLNFLAILLKEKISNKKFYITYISIRRGFFLGIFIEAFKLGS